MILNHTITYDNLDMRFFFNDPTPHKVVPLDTNEFDISRPHKHINHEVHYILSGMVVYEINNKTYTATKDSVLIIPPNHIHSLSFYTNDLSRFIMEFSISDNGIKSDTYEIISEIISNVLNRPLLLNTEIPEFREMYNLYYRKIDNNSLLHLMADNMYKSYSGIAFNKLLAAAQLHNKATLNDVDTQRHDSYYNVTPDTILIVSYICKNYANKPSIHELSKRLNVSVRHVERIIKKDLNSTFSQLLNEHRINLAKHIIHKNTMHSSKRLQDVSEELGFDNYHTFLKQFKHYTHMSPTEFKALIKNKFN